MKVCVVGLGKIGLPLAVQIAGRGHSMTGLDVNQQVVDTVASGSAPFPGEPGLDERLQRALSAGRLSVTTDPAAAVADADAVIIVVPLVVDAAGTPDFGALDAATAAVGPHLCAGALVSYETTLPLGTTRDRFAPRLETLSGLAIGTDLYVCHSPERVSSGRVFRDLRTYPKLVGGVDAESGKVAVAFYQEVLEFDPRDELERPNGVWDLGSAEAAEMAKLAETTYRDINIAFANELALIAEARGLDVWKVIEACNSQPFSHIHQPGIAVGGHCIPVYPHFLLAGAPEARLPAVARVVNSEMPYKAVERLIAAFDGTIVGMRVAVLGLAYRAGVKEHAFSGAFGLRDRLEAAGAEVVLHDPMYTEDEVRAMGFLPYRLGERCDAVVIHTAHDDYRDLALTWPDLHAPRVVVDGRTVVQMAPPGTRLLRIGVG